MEVTSSALTLPLTVGQPELSEAEGLPSWQRQDTILRYLLLVPASVFPSPIVWALLSSIFHRPHSLSSFFFFLAVFPLSAKARRSGVEL